MELCPKGSRVLVRKVQPMKKMLLAVAADATKAVAAVTPAQAQRGVAAGVAAGIIGGAIVGGALASPYYYGPGPGYYEPGYYPPRYYASGPGYVADDYYGGGCVWQKQRFWDGYGWRVRRVRVCG